MYLYSSVVLNSFFHAFSEVLLKAKYYMLYPSLIMTDQLSVSSQVVLLVSLKL